MNLNRTLGVIAAGSPGKSNIFHVTSLIRWQDPEHATPLIPPSFDCEFLFTALCVRAEAALRTSLLTTPGLRAICTEESDVKAQHSSDRDDRRRLGEGTKRQVQCPPRTWFDRPRNETDKWDNYQWAE